MILWLLCCNGRLIAIPAEVKHKKQETSVKTTVQNGDEGEHCQKHKWQFFCFSFSVPDKQWIESGRHDFSDICCANARW